MMISIHHLKSQTSLNWRCNMTVQDLLQKLEECRYNVEDSSDDRMRNTFDTLNEVISDIENDGLEMDEFFSSGRNRGRYDG